MTRTVFLSFSLAVAAFSLCQHCPVAVGPVATVVVPALGAGRVGLRIVSFHTDSGSVLVVPALFRRLLATLSSRAVATRAFGPALPRVVQR